MKPKKEMKKTVWLIVAVALVMVGAVVAFTAFDHNAVVYAAENRNVSEDEPVTAEVKLTEDEAINIALATVGTEAKLVGTELEDENGVIVYSVELLVNDAKFEILVDANSGLILDADEDADYEDEDEDADSEEDENDEDSEEPITEPVQLTQAQAVAIAEASLDSSATFVNAELEDENGVIVYGVHMRLNDQTYDIKVDANTGQILASEIDDDEEFDEED